MVNVSGHITLSGITDKEMGKIWEVKARNEKSFLFQPNQMQPAQSANQEPYYNNVVFNWTGEPGLQIVHEVLTFLLKKEEKAEAVAQ